MHINGGEVANIHAVPVPSQRSAFAKMVSKQQYGSSSTSPKDDMLEKSRTSNKERTCSIPSIEQMNLPTSNFTFTSTTIFNQFLINQFVVFTEIY